MCRLGSIRYYPRFPEAVPERGAGCPRVTQPFATLCTPGGVLTVRLACVRRAASVHPEPGSNSPFEKALQVKSINVVRPHLMTRAPTYPIHRNRRNSISIRFSVRSIRFSRCGPGPVGPRPPASLALGGKEIHYPPRAPGSRAGPRSTGTPQPGGRGAWGGGQVPWLVRRPMRAGPRTRARRGATLRDEQTQKCAINSGKDRLSAFP